jgi:hypothetical protein
MDNILIMTTRFFATIWKLFKSFGDVINTVLWLLFFEKEAEIQASASEKYAYDLFIFYIQQKSGKSMHQSNLKPPRNT